MWQNLHTHTHYCDGKETPEAYILKAEQAGVINLGFSSHAPLPFDNKWCMKPEALPDYLQVIQLMKRTASEVHVYAGLEVDYIPRVISPADFQSQLDYTIGSIHFVEQLPDGRRWEIDGTHQFFLEGFEQIFKNNIKDTLVRYFELTREMVQQATPDIVGHLDKIKIQNLNGALYSEDERWYREALFQTLDVIASAGCKVEVNTRGIYQRKSTTTYPGPLALQYMCDKHIPILLASDAHHPDDLVNQFEATAAHLYAIGFRSHAVLHNGQWQTCTLTPSGLDYPH